MFNRGGKKLLAKYVRITYIVISYEVVKLSGGI